MDKDTTRQKKDTEQLYRQFKAHKADVLIGTQMIAKGFHFPAVTLVGVLAADASLSIPDFRAGETVFQLILQVAGRAGRSELPGQVILQTFLPDHPLLQLAAQQDYETFYAKELEERKLFHYPPFCKMIKITCFGDNELQTKQACEDLRGQIKQAGLEEDTEILAVMPAAHAKVKDLYRYQFIIKAYKTHKLKYFLSCLSSKLRYKIDVDPINTFY
jgi:primosomal protein N' (replication factor Y)